MGPWSLVLIGTLITLVGGVMTTYGWSRLKQREEAFSLSLPPSIEVTARTEQKSRLVFTNTGQHLLKEVKVWPIIYEIENGKIKNRSTPSDGTPIASSWQPRQALTIPADKVVFWDATASTNSDPHAYKCLALVTVYRREEDNKRFVDIDLFLLANINGDLTLFPFLGSASGGPVQDMIKIFKEITDLERFVFKAD